MRRSLLLRLAWRQSLLRLLIIYALTVALGLWLDCLPWALLVVTALVALRGYWRLYRVSRFLDWRQQLQTVHGQGLWAALETLIHRRQTENRDRSRRLVSLLRAYRQAATAMPEGALIVNRRDAHLIWFNKSARRLLGLNYPQSLGSALTDTVTGPRVSEWLASGITDEALMDVPSPVDEHQRLSLRLIAYSPDQWLVVVRDVTQLMHT